MENKKSRPSSFCPRPWTHVYVHNSGLVKLCCFAVGEARAESRTMSVRSQDFEDIWNGNYFKSIRRKMLNGEKVAECQACHNSEKVLGESWRTKDIEAWEKGYMNPERKTFQELKTKFEHDKILTVNYPKWAQISLGNTCNLRCRMCDVTDSSKIAADPIQSRWRPGSAHYEPLQELGITWRTGIEYVKFDYPECDSRGPYTRVQDGGSVCFPYHPRIKSLSIKVRKPNEMSDWHITVSSGKRSITIPLKTDNIIPMSDLALFGVIPLKRFNIFGSSIEIKFRNRGCLDTNQNQENRILHIESIHPFEIIEKGRILRSKQPSMKHFLAGLPQEMFDGCEDLVLLGGEPFLEPKALQIMRRLIEIGRTEKIKLQIVTNGTVLTDQIIELLSHFQNLALMVSLDGIGKLNNYIRSDSDFEIISQNISKLYRLFGDCLAIETTLQSYNLFDLAEIAEFAEEQDLRMSWHPLHQPSFLSIFSLPISVREEAHKKLLSRIPTFTQSRRKVLEEASSILEDGLKKQENEYDVHRFIEYTRELDKARGQRFDENCWELARALKFAGYDCGSIEIRRDNVDMQSSKQSKSPREILSLKKVSSEQTNKTSQLIADEKKGNLVSIRHFNKKLKPKALN